MDQPVTLHLPEALYLRLKRDAERRRHSIEDELLDVVAASIAPDPQLPDDLKTALADLDLLADEELQRAAQHHLAPRDARRLEALHLKRQRDGLDATETLEAERLTARYERAMVIRARAALLLKQRGANTSEAGAQTPRT